MIGGGGNFGGYGSASSFGAGSDAAIARGVSDSVQRGDATSFSLQQAEQITSSAIRIAQEVQGSPIQRAAVARAKLQTAILEQRPLSTILELQAKVAAADRGAQVYQAGEASSQEWSNLGKIALAVGIGVGASVMLLVATKAFKA